MVIHTLIPYYLRRMTQEVEAIRYTEAQFIAQTEPVVAEQMLHILINGAPYTITMHTPGDEEALCRGILLSEDVYGGEKNPEFQVMQTNHNCWVEQVNIILNPADCGEGLNSQRNLMSVSSCGMCGKYDTELELSGPALETNFRLDPNQVKNIFQAMRAQQMLFAAAGGSHAAALMDEQNQLLITKEDIGRHNAVDKAIGTLLLKQKLQDARILLVSGRISYEIVSKCYRAGVVCLAAVSAPSHLAIEYCRQKGITLLAFCRDNYFTVYSHPERVIGMSNARVE